MTASLFESQAPQPLAERLRPKSLDEVIGQEHLLAPGAPLGRMLTNKRLSSIILQGPPGVGKTTIARLIARAAGLDFESLSAISSGVADLRAKLAAATDRRKGAGRATVLFLDEIHRWNSGQQDGLLPYVEDGTITLIGATTENVSFEINGALLSRCQVLHLRRLDDQALGRLVARAEEHQGWSLPLSPEARAALLSMADGDGRYLLNLCEQLFDLPPSTRSLDVAGLAAVVQRKAPAYDKGADLHHAMFSALQKSIRGSDVQAALYWMARMVKAGEPPKALFRRLAVMATEEIGLADPMAVQHTAACAALYDRVGDPEGWQALAQCVAYLATAVKSNAVYLAMHAAFDLAEQTGSLPPPGHIVNATKGLTKDESATGSYVYDHDAPHAFSGQEFMPDALAGERRPTLYRPNERGHEREIAKRLEFWDGIRSRRRGAPR